jgi:hypothetical protein
VARHVEHQVFAHHGKANKPDVGCRARCCHVVGS